jgi:two-component system, cell cycle sensor histidine kinase and response regulator CckA
MHGQDEGVGSRAASDAESRRAAIEELHDHAPVGCASLLEDGTILDANLTLALLLDVPREHVTGTSLLSYLDNDDRIAALQFLSRVTNAHGDAPLEVRVLQPSGTSRVCLLAASRSPQVSNIQVALMDETGRHVAERTALQAQKMEAIGRMAGGIAHDLNNLLTVVSVHDDFLLNALPDDDPKREDLLAIQDALRQAAEITRKLMAFARPQVLDRRRIAVNWLIEDTVRRASAVLPANRELSCVPALPSPDIEIDPSQLELVLDHLVQNAADAMPDGGRITIETASVELAASQLESYPEVKPGWFVRIRVTDTGIGMDPPTLSHAFEPYFTTKPRGEGRGLGLSTVYAVARQHGGFVTASSIVGDGTSVDIFLPEVEPAEPPSVSAPAPIEAEVTETILVAEDEPAIRTAIHRMLTKQGYVCHVAGDGEEALNILASLDGKVDLVLTDVVMPKCTGPELVRRLRAQYPKIPVVFMTGYASTDEMDGVPVPEISGVLHKPFALHALQKMVRVAIDGP